MRIAREFKNIIPKRKPDSHKGDYGHVLVLAGSAGLTGAAALCSQAPLLCGTGLVTLGIPESLNDIMGAKLTEVMTKPLPETNARTLSSIALKQILDFGEKSDALAIGPGLSRNPQTQLLVQEIVAAFKGEMVIDADAINALAHKKELLRETKSRIVLTPHAGEMARLVESDVTHVQRNREKLAKDFSKTHRVVLVLKGHKTVVANQEGKIYVNKTGNPGMATAGVGDILTGMIAGFMAQKIEPFEAAKLAVYLHGLAGDIAAKEKGQVSLIASDVLGAIPEAIKLVSK